MPLHAAAVVAGDHTLLLTGASGTGKSTMSYACAAAGFSVLAEDTVFVDLSGATLRLPGNAPQPGRAGTACASSRSCPTRRWSCAVRDGRPRSRAAAATPWAPTLTTAGRVSVVLLDCSSEEPSLTPIVDGEEAAGFFDEDEDRGRRSGP